MEPSDLILSIVSDNLFCGPRVHMILAGDGAVLEWTVAIIIDWAYTLENGGKLEDKGK